MAAAPSSCQARDVGWYGRRTVFVMVESVLSFMLALVVALLVAGAVFITVSVGFRDNRPRSSRFARGVAAVAHYLNGDI